MPIDTPKNPTSDDLADDLPPTEVEQPVLKKAEESGEDATRGTGIATAIAQA